MVDALVNHLPGEDPHQFLEGLYEPVQGLWDRRPLKTAVAAMALRSAGYRARNYPGSWHEWSRHPELAVEHIRNGVEQALKDVDTFFQEISLLQEWRFGSQQAAMISQPVLSVLGVQRKNLYMLDGRALLHSWFPQTEDLDVNATHLLQMQDPKGMAHGLAKFFSRHPMTQSQ